MVTLTALRTNIDQLAFINIWMTDWPTECMNPSSEQLPSKAVLDKLRGSSVLRRMPQASRVKSPTRRDAPLLF
uniref:Transposase n=1 Tax=Panagrellus redivivus TaxID=6233 RepID=A0A7E4UTZ1_PANRE